ncbi:hypothetical protein [Lederbergia citrea]|nr:hypothetical protein [Lederbergia citrea]
MTNKSKQQNGYQPTKIEKGFQPNKMQATPPPPKTGPNIKPQKDK